MFFRVLFITLIFLSTSFKAAPAESRDNFEEGLHRFLLHQRNEHTGILQSFIDSDDLALENQASTYDLALAGLGFLKLKDYTSAKRILLFFEKRWDGSGFSNFYDTKSGNPGLEQTVHLGPNMWVAILALQYTEETKDHRFYVLAKKIALWAAQLKHKFGGLSMGPLQDWGADWPNVFGAESNIVSYAVFKDLYEREDDQESKALFRKEMDGIRGFIGQIILVKDEEGNLTNISTGYNSEELNSKISACDIVSMLLLVFSPQDLQKYFSLKENDLINFADKTFFVVQDNMSGYDFTDAAACAMIGRPRMVSLEWTMQMACALQEIADFKNKASFLTMEVDKKMIQAENMFFYSYASKTDLQVFPFAPWWRTPQGNPEKCGAMSPTMWRLFYHEKFNPLK